jgi:gas vesicle structural protein
LRREPGGYLARPQPSSLADVVEIVLDKGITIDAYVRVSLLGVELLTFDARIVVASVDTYLRFAEAANRLDLVENGPPSLVEVVQSEAENAITGVASHVVENKVDEAVEKVGGTLGKPAEKAVRAVGRKVVDVAAETVDKAVGGDQDT